MSVTWLDRDLLGLNHKLLSLDLSDGVVRLNNELWSLDDGLLKCELLRLTCKLLCLNRLKCKDGLRHDNLWGRLLSLDLFN